MIFLLVLSHLVTDQLLAWFHSIHISIYMLSLRPLVAFAFNIRIQHSLELNSARKLNRFCIWKRKFLFRFVARNREKKPNLCRVSHHIPVRKCCCSACNPLDPTLSAPFYPLSRPCLLLGLLWIQFNEWGHLPASTIRIQLQLVNPFGQNEWEM